MAREKRETTQLCVRISKEMMERLDRYCDDSGQGKGIAVERSLAQFIANYYRNQEQIERINK